MPQNPPGNPAGNPDDPKKVSIVGKIPIEYDAVALNNIHNAIHEQTAAQQQANNASGTISERVINGQKKANTIAIVAAFVSGFGLAATIVIILLNYKAINAANRSANVADSTLAESRKEFELSNRPFIEMAALMLDSINEGQRPSVTCNLTNTGRLPALVTRYRSTLGLFFKYASADSVIAMLENSLTEKDEMKVGIVPFSPITVNESRTSDIPFPKGRIDSIRAGLLYFALVIQIRYTNLITKSRYAMVQILKIEDKGHLNFSSLKYIDEPDSSK